MISQKFKTLEHLVQETSTRLKKLAEENRKLRLDSDHLLEENSRLDNELKRLRYLGTRHERVRAKIERLVHRLERAAG